MAVTLSIADLSDALRLGNSAEELKEVTRLHAFASEAVDRYAPDAPENTANEAAVRLAAQLFDQPTSTRGGYSNALRISGAARILMPYRIHRAGSTADAVAIAQGAVGTTGNPVIDVDVSGAEIVVTFADGSTESHDLPAAGVMFDGTDQDARDAAAAAQGDATVAQATATTAAESAGVGRLAAAAAQVTADAAQTDIDDHEANHPSGGGSGTDQTARDSAATAQAEIDAHELSTHNTDTTARDAAATTQTELDEHEASTHNTDGTATSSSSSRTDCRRRQDRRRRRQRLDSGAHPPARRPPHAAPRWRGWRDSPCA